MAAKLVEAALKEGRHVVDDIDYLSTKEQLVIKSGRLWLSIGISEIEEFNSIPRDDLEGLELSPGGATIILEKHNIYIESASLIIDVLDRLLKERSGGIVMELLNRGWKPV